MASYIEELNQSTSCNDETESLEKMTFASDGKKEEKLPDITQQQWFWDQAVMS